MKSLWRWLREVYMEPVHWPLWPLIVLDGWLLLMPRLVSCNVHLTVEYKLELVGAACITLRWLRAHWAKAPLGDIILYGAALFMMPWLVAVFTDLLWLLILQES